MLDLYKELAKTRLNSFSLKYQKAFDRAPAAEHYHHNFTGGLLFHTTEILEIMFKLAKSLPYNNISYGKPDFTEEEMIAAAYLHDFAKIITYCEDVRDAWRYNDIELPSEIWTLNELAKAGIGLSDNELNALLYAEGGWSEYKDHIKNMKPLAVLLHMADMWSAKVLYITEEVSCPICGAAMRKRHSGKDGSIFYGCSRYPNCNGTKNPQDIDHERATLKEKIKNYRYL